MYQQLVAQLSNTFSQVLLLAPENNLSQLLKGQLQKSGFNVVRLDPLGVLNSKKIQQQLQQENFYKIIVLYGWAQELADEKNLSAWLQTRREPTLIIAQLDTFPKAQLKNVVGTKKRQKQEKVIIDFVTSLPKSSLLVGLDVIEKSYPHLGLAYICRDLSLRRLFNPKIDFHFISANQFLIQNSNVILAPYNGEKYFFKASNVDSERLIAQLLRHVDLGTQTIENPEPEQPFSPPFKLKTLLGISDLDFLSTNFMQQLIVFITVQPPLSPLTNKQKPLDKELIFDSLSVDTNSALPLPQIVLPKRKPPTKTEEILLEKFEERVMTQTGFYQQPVFSPDRNLKTTKRYVNITDFNLLTQITLPHSLTSPAKAEAIKVPPIMEVGYFERSLFIQTKKNDRKREFQEATRQVLERNEQLLTVATAINKETQTTSKPLKKKNKKPAKTLVLVKKKKTSKQQRKKILAWSAITVSVLAVSSWLIVPRYQQHQRQTAFQSYFNTCYQKQNCFTQEGAQQLANLATEGVKSSNSVAALALQIQELSAQRRILDQQLARFYKTVMQKEVGDVDQEIQLVNNQAEATLDKIDLTQTTLQAATADLKTLLPELNLDSFTAELNNLKTDILLWQKYQDFFSVLADQENLDLVFALLDNTQLLSQGGQLLAFDNFKLNFGQLEKGELIPATTLIENSKIKVEANEIFTTKKPTTSIVGIYHLPFQKDFATFSDKVNKLFELEKEISPDLIIGLNLNTYAKIASLNTEKTQTEIFQDSLEKLKSSATDTRSTYLMELYQKLWLNLGSMNDQQQIATLIFTILEQINQQEIAFGSNQPGLSEFINTLGLNNDHVVTSCPASLNSQGECYLDNFSQTRSVLNGEALITQENTHFLDLQPQNVAHTRTITYKNQGDKKYSEYLSFNLPEGAQFGSLTINGATQEMDDNGGFIIDVPAQSTVMATLTFKIDRTLNKNNFVYSFSEQKQVGSWGEKLQVIFKNSLPYSPKLIAPSATIENKRINFNVVQDQSFLGAVSF